MALTTVPIHCPQCLNPLYPIQSMRPQPKSSPLAVALYVLAGLMAAGILWGGIIRMLNRAEKMAFENGQLIHLGRASAIGALLIFLPPSLAVGVGIGFLARKLPRRITMRCKHCSWWEVYKLSGKGVTTATPIRNPTITPWQPETQPTISKPVSTPAEASPFDQIVDENQGFADAKAWIWIEFMSGREAELITADLVTSGWDYDVAQAMVEEGRKLTRHARIGAPPVPSADPKGAFPVVIKPNQKS